MAFRCAHSSDFLASSTDKVSLTPGLVNDVGRVVASFQGAMGAFQADGMPQGGTFVEGGMEALRLLEPALERRGLKVDLKSITKQWGRASKPFLANAGDSAWGIIHAYLAAERDVCRRQG